MLGKGLVHSAHQDHDYEKEFQALPSLLRSCVPGKYLAEVCGRQQGEICTRHLQLFSTCRRSTSSSVPWSVEDLAHQRRSQRLVLLLLLLQLLSFLPYLMSSALFEEECAISEVIR